MIPYYYQDGRYEEATKSVLEVIRLTGSKLDIGNGYYFEIKEDSYFLGYPEKLSTVSIGKDGDLKSNMSGLPEEIKENFINLVALAQGIDIPVKWEKEEEEMSVKDLIKYGAKETLNEYKYHIILSIIIIGVLIWL